MGLADPKAAGMRHGQLRVLQKLFCRDPQALESLLQALQQKQVGVPKEWNAVPVCMLQALRQEQAGMPVETLSQVCLRPSGLWDLPNSYLQCASDLHCPCRIFKNSEWFGHALWSVVCYLWSVSSMLQQRQGRSSRSGSRCVCMPVYTCVCVHCLVMCVQN